MRIALVDPSRTNRLIVARMLETRGHEVVPFADEREALDHIKSDTAIEALITSAELKYMSGVELCWETRLLATSRRPIYVLMMSSQYDYRNLIEALDSGADDFIGKPPLAEELYARLRAAERPVLEEGRTTCCYARSEKSWIADPDGLVWETFYTDGEATTYGDGPALGTLSDSLGEAKCCLPKAAA